MKLKHTDILDVDRDSAYSLVKNNLSELAAYMPNIEKIECLKQEPIDQDTSLRVNRWFAKLPLPSLLRGVLNPKFFSWEDTATWSDQDFSVSYELKSFLADDIFFASGKNVFVENDGKTHLNLECSLKIKAENVPGIPRLFSKKVEPLLEKIIGQMLEPNMIHLGNGIKAYFAEKN